MLELRPQERGHTAAAFLTLFGAMAAHQVLETARDAMFLARLPAAHLPWVYMAIAALAIVFARGNLSCAARCPGRGLLAGTLLGAGVVTAGMWWLASVAGEAALYALYVWTGLAATILVVQFWLLLSDAFTVSQAKRLYAVVGAGGLLGATAGSALAGALVPAVGASGLVLVAAGLFAVAALGPRFIASPERVPGPVLHTAHDEAPTRGGLALLGHPYLRRVAAIVLIASVAVTATDFVFKSVVAAEVAPERLGSFFAQVYVGLNGLALVIQLGLAAWLVRAAGVSRTLAVVPVLLAAATLGFVLAPGVALALVLKGTDGGLRHSVQRTTIELLYVPLPAELRYRFKAFIEAVGQRGGQALASVAILGALAFGVGPVLIAGGVLALLALWLLAIVGLRQHYLELFRQQLRGGTIDVRAELPELDLHQLELLMSSLNSDDDATVVGALDLLAEHGKVSLVPALILYHPSRRVVLRALDLFAAARRRDFSPIAARLIDSGDDEIRAAAVRAKSSVDPDEQRLRALLADPSDLLRATALVALITRGLMSPSEAEAALRELLAGGSPPALRALAQAIDNQPDERLGWVLIELGRGSDPAVLDPVAEAIAGQPDPKFLPTLLRLLAIRQVRPTARRALLAVGPAALDFLDGALSDPELPLPVRRHVPRTISRFASASATDILVRHLADERDGMTRFKILRGLGRMQADNPRLAIDRAAVRAIAHRTLRRIIAILSWRTYVDQSAARDPTLVTRGSELLVSLFREKERNATERLFRLLDLLWPRQDFRLVHAGLHSDDAKSRASARELIEHVVDGDLREPLLALTDDVPDAARLRRLQPYHQPPAVQYQALLEQLLADGSEAVRCIAAYHIGELHMEALREPLAAARPAHAGYLADVFDHALGLLARPRVEEVAQRAP